MWQDSRELLITSPGLPDVSPNEKIEVARDSDTCKRHHHHHHRYASLCFDRD
jgi:hypothetical protein